MFRRIFNLEDFFQDHRCLCHLLIDVDKYRTIQDVENRIKLLFSINEEIYLSDNDASLPSLEDINVLTLSSDIIRVKKVNVENSKNEPNRDNRVGTEDRQTTKSKRKEKKRKRQDEEDIVYMCNVYNHDNGGKNKKLKKEKRKRVKNVSADDCDVDGETNNLFAPPSDSDNVSENNTKSTVTHISDNDSAINRNTGLAKTRRNTWLETENTYSELATYTEEDTGNISVDFQQGENKSVETSTLVSLNGDANKTKTRKRTRIRRHRRKAENKNLKPEQSAKVCSLVKVNVTHSGANTKSNHIRFGDIEEQHHVNNYKAVNSATQSTSLPPSLVNDEDSAKAFPSSLMSHSTSWPIENGENEEINGDSKQLLVNDSAKIINDDADCPDNQISYSGNEVDNNTSTAPVWFKELMKVKQMSQLDKPPLFCRTHKANKDDQVVRCSEETTSCTQLINEDADANTNHTLLIDDIVDFKILFLSQGYTPTVSDSVIGRVIKVSDTLIKLKILYGKEICEPLSGKFALPDTDEGEKIDSEEDREEDVVELLMKDLINPKKVFNTFEMFGNNSTLNQR